MRTSSFSARTKAGGGKLEKGTGFDQARAGALTSLIQISGWCGDCRSWQEGDSAWNADVVVTVSAIVIASNDSLVRSPSRRSDSSAVAAPNNFGAQKRNSGNSIRQSPVRKRRLSGCR